MRAKEVVHMNNIYPFSVFKRADRSCFSVAFKGEDGKYLRPVSTGKKTYDEAMQVAFLWLRDGVPQKQKTSTIQDLYVKEIISKVKNKNEVENILDELQRKGWVKSHVLKDEPQAVNFITFLKDFWDWDTSPYIKEKLRKSHGIHKSHCKKQSQAIELFWRSFFVDKHLGDISITHIDAFINHMGEKDLSASRKNGVIKAGTKALRWAFSKGMIDIDPTRGHLLFSGDEAKRNILTPTAAAALFRTTWINGRAKLANMLASVTGMRSGEILALHFQDIGADCIYVSHSWNIDDKRKRTKNLKPRTVEIPFPGLIKSLFEVAQQNPWGVKPDSFVFWSDVNKDSPMSDRPCVKWLRKALVDIGFTTEQADGYDFHGWRHFFTAYIVHKLEKKLVKGQTGHLTDVMYDHYANHETVGDRERIQNAKLETFAGLLPEPTERQVFSKVAGL